MGRARAELTTATSSPHTDPVDGSHYCTNYDCHAHPRPDGDSYADGYSGSHTSPVADSHPYAGGRLQHPLQGPRAARPAICNVAWHNRHTRTPVLDYEAKYYPYPQSVEPKIVEAQGSIYGPYTDTWFDSIRDTDIEHIVARFRGHDSGLCAADPDTKDEFASDPINLTLASPASTDTRKWTRTPPNGSPDLNQCCTWNASSKSTGSPASPSTAPRRTL